MTTRLFLLVAAGAAGLALSACEMDYEPAEASAPPPPPPIEAPAVEDAAVEAAAEAPEPAQQTAPPPTDSGDMGDARAGEESVQPDSETVFY